jgi:hypothetical protein
MRKKTYRALALGLLLALGLAVSAYATPQKPWPRTAATATTTTTAAATTTAATTTDSTAEATTTVATTDSTTTSNVKIWSPSMNSAWVGKYSNVILGATVTGAVAGGTCTINWGDGTVGEAPLVTNGSGYSCSATHQYMANPPGVSYTKYTITVTAVDASALPVGSDYTQIYVI